MEKLGDSGGTNSLIEKLKEKKLDEELYKTKCNSQEITYDYFKGLKEREKLQEENNKLQEEEKSEVPLSSSKSSSSKSSEDSKENTENNQIDTLSSLNSSGNWQVKLLNADVLNPHIIMSKILLCEEYCEVERFPNATLTCFEVNENRAELIKQFCQFIIKRFAMMNNENTEHLGIKFIIQIANLKRHKMREWRNNEIRIRTNPLVISPQIQNANPINLIFFLEHTPLNLEFYNLFSISDTFQNEDSYCPVKYWRSIDDEMGNIEDVRETYQCQEINNQMYSNNSWIVLLKAIHSYIESLSNPEDDQPQCIEFPKYWDFIKGMDGIHVHNTLSEVVMVNERLEVMDEIRYVRDNYEVESLSKIQNMFIYICYQALYKFYESTIKKKRIEVHKLLIRLNQDNSDEKLERLLFDCDPCEMNMRLIHNNIFRFPDGSLSKEHIEVLDSLLDNENDSFLLCDFLVPKTQGKPECYPLPFIYPRYVLKFKGRRQ